MKDVFENMFGDDKDGIILDLKERIRNLEEKNGKLSDENTSLKNRIRDARDLLSGIGKLQIAYRFSS